MLPEARHGEGARVRAIIHHSEADCGIDRERHDATVGGLGAKVRWKERRNRGRDGKNGSEEPPTERDDRDCDER